MNKDLMTLEKEIRITSVELVELINQFRLVESEALGKGYKELRHDSFMSKITKEVEILKKLKPNSLQNFLESTYTNPRGKVYNCYSLNKKGMLHMLNSESTLVRLETTEYIEKLEEELKNLKQLDSYMIEDKVERAKRWIEEEEERKRLSKENVVLIEDNKKKDETIKELSPLAELARKRMDATGTVSITDVTVTYNLKRGQLTTWAKTNGYIHKKLTEVNTSGRKYFKVVSTDGIYKNIAITEEGIKFIDENIEEISNSPCRFKA